MPIEDALPALTWRELSNQQFPELRNSLNGWAQQHGLSARWCLDWALRTLNLWRFYPEYISVGWNPMISDEVPGSVSFSVDGWGPGGSESFETFRKRARRELNWQLEEYLAEQQAEAAELGFATWPGF